MWKHVWCRALSSDQLSTISAEETLFSKMSVLRDVYLLLLQKKSFITADFNILWCKILHNISVRKLLQKSVVVIKQSTTLIFSYLWLWIGGSENSIYIIFWNLQKLWWRAIEFSSRTKLPNITNTEMIYVVFIVQNDLCHCPAWIEISSFCFLCSFLPF